MFPSCWWWPESKGKGLLGSVMRATRATAFDTGSVVTNGERNGGGGQWAL